MFIDEFNLLEARGSESEVTTLIQRLAFYTSDGVIIQCFINCAFVMITSKKINASVTGAKVFQIVSSRANLVAANFFFKLLHHQLKLQGTKSIKFGTNTYCSFFWITL